MNPRKALECAAGLSETWREWSTEDLRRLGDSFQGAASLSALRVQLADRHDLVPAERHIISRLRENVMATTPGHEHATAAQKMTNNTIRARIYSALFRLLYVELEKL